VGVLQSLWTADLFVVPEYCPDKQKERTASGVPLAALTPTAGMPPGGMHASPPTTRHPMSRFIDGEARTQRLLFPERLDDWIAEDNPCGS